MTTDPYGTPPPEPNYSAPPAGDFTSPLPDRSEAASKKLAAGITGIIVGGFGVHKFILGYTNAAAIMLAISLASFVGGIVTCGITIPAMAVMQIIGLVEGIIYLTKSDEEFYRTYMVGKKEWF